MVAMHNPPDTYREAGKRAAVAMNEKDQSRYDFIRNWYRSAVFFESPGAAKDAARAAWDEGYRTARNTPPVDPFK